MLDLNILMTFISQPYKCWLHYQSNQMWVSHESDTTLSLVNILVWIIMVDFSHSRLGSKPWYVDWLWSNYLRNCTCQFNLNCLKWIHRILFEFQCILYFHRIPKVYCRRPENSKLALLVRTTSRTQSTRCAGRSIVPKMSIMHQERCLLLFIVND